MRNAPTLCMKTTDKSLVIGAFRTSGHARAALESLREAGFSSSDVGVLSHDKEGDADIKSLKEMSGNKAGAGAAAGAAVGAGGGALWALGIAAGILPAIGPVIAGGILAAVAASAATGAAAGGVVGALTGLGVSDEDAAYYDEEFRKGRTVVIVKAGNRTDEAFEIMRRHEAHHRTV